MDTKPRHQARSSSQSIWWRDRRPVRDAEVASIAWRCRMRREGSPHSLARVNRRLAAPVRPEGHPTSRTTVPPPVNPRSTWRAGWHTIRGASCFFLAVEPALAYEPFAVLIEPSLHTCSTLRAGTYGFVVVWTGSCDARNPSSTVSSGTG
jgi:hypothetical protein